MPSSKNERADRAARGLAAPTGEPLRDELAATGERFAGRYVIDVLEGKQPQLPAPIEAEFVLRSSTAPPRA